MTKEHAIESIFKTLPYVESIHLLNLPENYDYLVFKWKGNEYKFNYDQMYIEQIIEDEDLQTSSKRKTDIAILIETILKRENEINGEDDIPFK